MGDEKENSGERQKQALGLGRRPFDYKGSQGWQQRIYIPALVAGVLGGGAVMIGSYSRGFDMVKHSGAVALNSTIVTSCFCGAQELVRELRASEPGDLINSVVGGIASGGLLGRLQGGRPKAIQYAFLFTVVGTGVQFGVNIFKEYNSEKPVSVTAVKEIGSRPASKESWTLPKWFPIQKLDKEEAAKRAQERDLNIQRTVEKMKKGESL